MTASPPALKGAEVGQRPGRNRKESAEFRGMLGIMISCQGARRYRNESTGLTVKLGNYKYTKRRLTTVWLTRVFFARGVSCLQASHGYRVEGVGLKGKLVNHKSERVRSSHVAGARLFLQGGVRSCVQVCQSVAI